MYVYERDGVSVTMIATLVDGDELALGLIYTEGQQPTDPTTMELGGHTVIVFPANRRDTASVQIAGVCELYDLWASWTDLDTTTIALDLASVANQAECDGA